MNEIQNQSVEIPLTGAKWAARSEAYAALVAEHLNPRAAWLDAGCGRRLLEKDMDTLEQWLVHRCAWVVGMDFSVTTHCNLDSLVAGSVDALPFGDDKFDLVTCNMVVEHLDHPAKAFCEFARCLRPGGTLVIHTTNLLNYGVMANAIASKLLPEKWRLWLVRQPGGREYFPVRYKANTRRRLLHLLCRSGLQVRNIIGQPQRGPYSRHAARLEKLLMPLTPFSGLLVCAHKPRWPVPIQRAADTGNSELSEQLPDRNHSEKERPLRLDNSRKPR